MKEYDVRNLACPGPVLKLRDLLDAGETEIRFRVADELSRSNLTRFATARGAEVDVEATSDGTCLVTIVAGADSATTHTGEEDVLAREAPRRPGGSARRRPLVIQVASDTMGSGGDELGALLLRSFVKTQAQLERRPDTVIFYNSGVKLCCDGSLLLEDLRQLRDTGVEIIACGTCLNYFQLSDRLAIGRVADMLEIASRLAEAGAVVRP